MQTCRNSLFLVLIAVASTASMPSFAKDPVRDDVRTAALRSAELARFQAQVDADAAALDQLLDDSLEYTHSNSDLDTKQSFIESLTSGRRDYVATTPDIQSIRIHGDIGVIRGRAKVTVADNGQSRDLDLGYVDVWVWKEGRWQMTTWLSARYPGPAAQVPAPPSAPTIK
jgi:hypothetical protein